MKTFDFYPTVSTFYKFSFSFTTEVCHQYSELAKLFTQHLFRKWTEIRRPRLLLVSVQLYEKCHNKILLQGKLNKKTFVVRDL